MTDESAGVGPGSVDARRDRYVLYDEVNGPYIRWQLAQFDPYLGRRILEVGSGVGAILGQLGDREHVMGIDLEPKLVELLRTRFADRPGYEFAALDISALSDADRSLLKERRFDTVICVNVLEHIEHDVVAIRAMADVLVPGGVIALLVPAHPALYGPYDAVDGHFRRYTRSSLRRVFDDAGVAVERLHYFNVVGAAGWWFQYKVKKRDHQTQSDYRLMQAVVPVMSRVERVIKPPVGMSVIAVGRKKS